MAAVKNWEQYLTDTFEGKITPREANHTSLKDAWSLFGEGRSKKTLKLRTSSQSRRGKVFELPQFDPYFYTRGRSIPCRMAGCDAKKPRFSERGKEDLYLCPLHRGRLMEHVKEHCSQHDVVVDFEKYRDEDFEGYTSLLGFMERAYFLSVKGGRGAPRILKDCPPVVREVFLNMRNYLLIVNSVLNPRPCNLQLALPPVLSIFAAIVQQMNNNVSAFIRLLREVMEMVLFSFGVLYTWVSITFRAGGAFAGMIVGGGGGAMIGGTAFGPIGALVGGGLGLLGGGVIGGVASLLRQETRQTRERDEALRRYRDFMQQPDEPRRANGDPQEHDEPEDSDERPPLFYFEGDLGGGITLALE